MEGAAELVFNSEREVSCGTRKIPDAVKSNADESIGPQNSARRNEVGIKLGELQKSVKRLCSTT